MSNIPPNSRIQIDEVAAQELMRSLLHKEGCWVDWGKTCQKLQKAGYSPQRIFEDTGFQTSQQNLVIVAAQVYDNVAQQIDDEQLLQYYRGPRTDVLYEFRILNQEQRASAAQLAYEKQIDVDGAHEVAKTIKDVSRLSQLPEAFTSHPGDAMAYFCWKHARQKKDLQARTRLIAKGLKFAHSKTARGAIERLLSDFTVIPSLNAPLLPIYRLEVEDELTRIIPVAGSYPLTSEEINQVLSVEVKQPFGNTVVPANVAIVPVPGWQVVLKAIDPVGYFCSSDRLPKSLPGKPEEVLVIVDRQAKEWDVNSHFLVEIEGKVEVKWFETAPEEQIVGKLVLILRPKKILDENNLLEPWQMDD